MAFRARLRRWWRRGLAPGSVLLLLLVALYMAADAEGLGARYARYYPYVFVAAAAALLLIAVAIGNRLWRLLRQLREGVPGARLTRRLVLLLVLLALPPVLLVYGFGVRFVSATVDSWFRVNSGAVLGDALEIAQLYLQERMQHARAATEASAAGLGERSGAALDVELDAALGRSGAEQLALYARDGRLLALAAATPRAFASQTPEDGMRLAALNRGHYAATEPDGDGLRLRVLVAAPGPGARLLQGLYPLPQDYGRLARSVENGIHAYRQAEFLRGALKLAFILILSFVLLLSLLLALLLAFDLTRRLVAPIARLADATRAVAAGDYAQHVRGGGGDELGFLVESFNRMTAELSAASARERASAAETERQRAHLETVLVRLSSGVFGIDLDGTLRTANPAADVILGAPLSDSLGESIGALAERLPRAAPLVAVLRQRLAEGAREWRQEVALDDASGRQLLLLRGAALPDGGLVAVFDDTTGIDRARRDAAWAEVARRLAHEVKNPLTPIQLAAERLRRRVLPRLADEDANVLERATATIVAQVESLKTMVNAFSEYARPPALALRPLDLNALVDEVLELYETDATDAAEAAASARTAVRVRRQFAADLPALAADADRLRQVLHNLLKNAIEAAPPGQSVELEVGTAVVEQAGRRSVELSVADNGPGLPADFDAGWFEPYRTTKSRGTGLGLAIVRKIAEEHGGQLLAGNRAGGGARFALRLPLADAALRS